MVHPGCNRIGHHAAARIRNDEQDMAWCIMLDFAVGCYRSRGVRRNDEVEHTQEDEGRQCTIGDQRPKSVAKGTHRQRDQWCRNQNSDKLVQGNAFLHPVEPQAIATHTQKPGNCGREPRKDLLGAWFEVQK